MTCWRTALGASVALALLAGCGGGDSADTDTVSLPAGCAKVAAPKPRRVHLPAPSSTLAGPAKATVESSCGSFTIELATARAPKTASSFAYLARRGVYDETLFHRIVPGFVVQGGDPTGSGTGGPGYSVDEAPPQTLSYTRGIVAMAKSPVEPPGRSGSQFFVVTAADAGLTPDYALAGRVTSGFDAVKRIEELGTSAGTPKAPVVIRRVTVEAG